MMRAEDIWCCPLCKGGLNWGPDVVHCALCGRDYPIVADIPDFRIACDAWIDFDLDRERACVVDGLILQNGLRAGIEEVFLNSRKFTPDKSLQRTRQVLSGVDKCDTQLSQWLAPFAAPGTLEIGSGPGQLLAAAARRGECIAGIDVSLEWLVVSKHLVAANGGEALLAAGLAEALPVRSGAIQAVISLDVIEHVGDQAGFVRELSRVLAPGGRFALSTPNRFSLSPEPHVGVWGVGYLPVSLQAAWVRLVSGQEYAYTRLLSRSEVLRLFEPDRHIEASVEFPPIASEDISLFSRGKARLANLYNRLIKIKPLRQVLPLVGAYYRVLGSKAVSRPVSRPHGEPAS